MKPSILVVDDTPENLHLLMGILEEQGYDVRLAPNGALALRFAQTTPPDLILLDIKMPGMDGYQVCEQLKADDRTREIPVIFLSALDDAVDKVIAFTIGGVDYITKPFKVDEVLARVETHLTLRRLQQELQVKNTQLQHAYEQLEQHALELTHTLDHLKATQEKLIQSEKMAALGQLVAGVAHEINTPVGNCVMAISFLEEQTHEVTAAYAAETLPRSKLEKYFHLAKEFSASILSNLNKVAKLIQQFKQVAVDQNCEEKRSFRLKEYIEMSLLHFNLRHKATIHKITVNCPEHLALYSYPGALMQIMTHLLENSLLHGFEHLEQGQISIEVDEQSGELLLRYSDNGKGMTKEQQEKIFEPFFTTKRAKGGVGLGMHIVYNLVTQTLGGQIECQSEINQGTTFIIQIPVREELHE